MGKYYDEEPVIGSYAKYHRRSCQTIARIEPYNKKELRSWKDAVDIGLEPCRVCKPYGYDWADKRPNGSGVAIVKITTLSDWRRRIIRLLDNIDSKIETLGPKSVTEGVSGKIGRLSRAGAIPRETGQLLRTIVELRNVAEYEAKQLSAKESKAVQAAWEAVKEWADANHYSI